MKHLKNVVVYFLIFLLAGCNQNKYSLNETKSENYEDKQINDIFIESQAEQVEDEKLMKKILSLANNKDDAESLIKTIYPDEVLNRNNAVCLRLIDVINETPPECVRVSEDGNYMYFVYKSETGRYNFYMYDLNGNSNVGIPWYCGKTIRSENFEYLRAKGATRADVLEYDPYGRFVSLYTGICEMPYTSHNTVDGHMIVIEYAKDGKISNIIKYTEKENPVYYNLLQIDKALIKEDKGEDKDAITCK